MKSDTQVTAGGFVLAADEGQAFWFLNTLTINKVGGGDSQGRLSIVDHRVPAGFAPPPHVHEASDEAFLVLDGDFEGFCGDQAWRAGPGSLVFLPHGIPHGFHVSQAGPPHPAGCCPRHPDPPPAPALAGNNAFMACA
jgi:quercetin dioxygenase-like cupin family protein